MKLKISLKILIFFLVLLSSCKDGSEKKDTPVNFGYNMNWLAIKSTEKNKIFQLLKLKIDKEVTWQKGIETIYTTQKLFVSPSVGKWTIIAGNGLPYSDTKDSVEKIKNLLIDLSKEFGEAYFFGTHRIVELQSWIKAKEGKIERVYSYIGESMQTIASKGELVAVEKKVNLFNSLSKEAQGDSYFEREDIFYPDEEFVMRMAEYWSINPTKLSNRKDIENQKGYIGNIK